MMNAHFYQSLKSLHARHLQKHTSQFTKNYSRCCIGNGCAIRKYSIFDKSKRRFFCVSRLEIQQQHNILVNHSLILPNVPHSNENRNYAITAKKEKVTKLLKERFEAFKKSKTAEAKRLFAESEEEKRLARLNESDVIHIDQDEIRSTKKSKKSLLSRLKLNDNEASSDPSIFYSSPNIEEKSTNSSVVINEHVENESINDTEEDISLDLLLKQRIKDHQVPASRKEARKIKKESLSSTSLRRDELYHMKENRKIFEKKTVPVLKTDSKMWQKNDAYKPTYIAPSKAKFAEIFDDINDVVHQPEKPKILKVSIIGNPNAGKSTFLNAIVGEKVSAVSHKVCTTRNNILGIFTEGDSQILFFDTPGILQREDKRLYKKNEDIMGEAYASLYDADMAILFIDATKDLSHINHLLAAVEAFYLKYRFKSQDPILPRGIVAVVNKIDLITPKNRVGDIVHELQRSSLFSRVFPLSAKQGEGLVPFKMFLLSKARPGKWAFNKDKKTDLTKEERLIEIVREKIFIHVHSELPYDCEIEIPKPISFFDHKRTKESSASVGVLINCPSPAAVRIVVGQLKPLHAKAVRELEEILKRKVYITFNVKLKKDLR